MTNTTPATEAFRRPDFQGRDELHIVVKIAGPDRPET